MHIGAELLRLQRPESPRVPILDRVPRLHIVDQKFPQLKVVFVPLRSRIPVEGVFGQTKRAVGQQRATLRPN